MNLLPPDHAVELYEEGFDSNDPLGRAPVGKRLSELVERIDDPLVIAVDGRWGSGKSYFLKRWVGAHVLDNGGKATTVYFDAFEHDYLDDPLVALTGAIGERFERAGEASGLEVWEQAKSIVAKLARPALRIGAAALTGGITSVAGPIVDATAQALRDEAVASVDEFWKRENAKREAMQQFRDMLVKLTVPASDGAEPTRLVVVIDELDRCRPDYALSLLETIKHFFAVPHVHFVLGVNLDELENSVRARYGAGVSTGPYLQKFITLFLELPEHLDERDAPFVQLKYFRAKAREMGLNAGFTEVVERYLAQALPNENLSLRGVQRLLSGMTLVPDKASLGNIRWGYQWSIAGLLVLRVAAPEIYRRAKANAATLEEIASCFRLPYGMALDDTQWEAQNRAMYLHWAYMVEPKLLDASPEDRSEIENSFEAWTRRRGVLVSDIARKFLENFSLDFPTA